MIKPTQSPPIPLGSRLSYVQFRHSGRTRHAETIRIKLHRPKRMGRSTFYFWIEYLDVGRKGDAGPVETASVGGMTLSCAKAIHAELGRLIDTAESYDVMQALDGKLPSA